MHPYSYINLRCVPASCCCEQTERRYMCVYTHVHIWIHNTCIHQNTRVCTRVVSGKQTERVLCVDGLCEISDVYLCVWECLEKIGRLLWNGLQGVGVCCRVLECVAGCCSHERGVCCGLCCSVVHCVGVRCSVLQGVAAVCCRVL